MTNGNRILRLLFATSALICAGAAFAQGRISSLEVLNRIQPGVTTSPQVRELLGAPARTLRFPARGIEVLEYDARDYGRIVVAITVAGDGKVRDVTRIVPSHP